MTVDNPINIVSDMSSTSIGNINSDLLEPKCATISALDEELNKLKLEFNNKIYAECKRITDINEELLNTSKGYNEKRFYEFKTRIDNLGDMIRNYLMLHNFDSIPYICGTDRNDWSITKLADTRFKKRRDVYIQKSNSEPAILSAYVEATLSSTRFLVWVDRLGWKIYYDEDILFYKRPWMNKIYNFFHFRKKK